MVRITCHRAQRTPAIFCVCDTQRDAFGRRRNVRKVRQSRRRLIGFRRHCSCNARLECCSHSNLPAFVALAQNSPTSGKIVTDIGACADYPTSNCYDILRTSPHQLCTENRDAKKSNGEPRGRQLTPPKRPLQTLKRWVLFNDFAPIPGFSQHITREYGQFLMKEKSALTRNGA